MPSLKTKHELTRVLTSQDEVNYFNKKDKHSNIKIGCEVNRFNSIEQIHEMLINDNPCECIITYLNHKPFKDMLFVVNGVNLGYKGLGNEFTAMPTSCWSDLLPKPSDIKIKCNNCGKNIQYNEIVDHVKYLDIEDKHLSLYNINDDMDEPCCDKPRLLWNILF